MTEELIHNGCISYVLSDTRAIKLLDRAKQLLIDLEFSGYDQYADSPCCPECRAFIYEDHWESCTLKSLRDDIQDFRNC